MDSYILIYRGKRRISALRSIRGSTSLTLVQSKKVMDNPKGFIVTSNGANNILRDYLETDVDHALANVLDWSVTIFDNSMPVDLRWYEPATPL